MKAVKLCLLCAICFLISVISSYASEESLTITTYYPSPYGSYRELRSQRIAIGDTYINGGTYSWDNGTINADADLVVEGNVGIGTTNFTPYPPKLIVNTFGANGVVFTGDANLSTYLHIRPDIGNTVVKIDGWSWSPIIPTSRNISLNSSGGNVGIGTVTPGAKLDVNGNISAESNQWGSCVWRDATHTSDHRFYCNNGEYVAGVQYESAEWTEEFDNHSWPEINSFYCCKL